MEPNGAKGARMSEPKFWNSKTHPATLALRPLSGVYALAEGAKRFFIKPQHPGKPVVCVGNLTAGGAGKTPTVDFLAQHFAAQGLSPAILSRGYGGQLSTTSGPAVRVDRDVHTASQVGDEPLMMAADWPVYISPDRFASLRAALAQGADIAIKDDGFQNPSMQHHFNLLVIDGASGLGNGYMLPSGPLRQPLAVGLSKADALLILGPPSHASLGPLIAQCASQKVAVFYGHIIGHKPKLAAGEKAFAYCGIAKPEKFLASLEASGVALVGHRAFGDHHVFSEAEADDLLQQGATLITTQKDMARLSGAPIGSKLHALAEQSEVLKIHLDIENADALMRLLDETVKARQANQSYTSY
jgi:tetraacyldisaccharide 4'-kinase